MIATEQIEAWQTAGQQQLTQLTTLAREHRRLMLASGLVAVAAVTGAVTSLVVAKGLLVAKGAVAAPVAISGTMASHAAPGVSATLAQSTAALGQAASLAKDAVATGATTLQNANALLTSVTTGGSALSSQLTALLHTVSSNILPLTAGAVSGGAVGVGVTQRQVGAVEERLQVQTTKAAAYQAEADRLQQALTDIVAPKAAPPAPEPALPPFQESLEQIRGIGPIFARQLRAAGILTFADLAAQTPEQLRTIMTGVRANRMFNPQAWIDEARQRIGQAVPPVPSSEPEQRG